MKYNLVPAITTKSILFLFQKSSWKDKINSTRSHKRDGWCGLCIQIPNSSSKYQSSCQYCEQVHWPIKREHLSIISLTIFFQYPLQPVQKIRIVFCISCLTILKIAIGMHSCCFTSYHYIAKSIVNLTWKCPPNIISNRHSNILALTYGRQFTLLRINYKSSAYPTYIVCINNSFSWYSSIGQN